MRNDVKQFISAKGTALPSRYKIYVVLIDRY